MPSSSVKSIASRWTGKAQAGLLDRAQHLQRRQHTQRAVVAPAVGHRIEVRAEQERAGIWVGAAQERRMVAGRVDLELQPGSLRTLPEPMPAPAGGQG